MNNTAQSPQESRLNALAVTAFAHAVHAASFHRLSDGPIVEFHHAQVVKIAVELEAELTQVSA